MGICSQASTVQKQAPNLGRVAHNVVEKLRKTHQTFADFDTIAARSPIVRLYRSLWLAHIYFPSFSFSPNIPVRSVSATLGCSDQKNREAGSHRPRRPSHPALPIAVRELGTTGT
jgi:hypothetical protein